MPSTSSMGLQGSGSLDFLALFRLLYLHQVLNKTNKNSWRSFLLVLFRPGAGKVVRTKPGNPVNPSPEYTSS